MAERMIIHVDMDAFYASVEVRDNPELLGKPLIIGALPGERGVVATCSYEARRYGVHSAMNIKEAYRRCPHGVYMHGNYAKYRAVSAQLHEIWNGYAQALESIALDEAYLDVTGRAGDWQGACAIARTIKQRTRKELGLSCSVGVAYCKAAAKMASEEKKPDGYFEIPGPEAFVALILDRDVRVLSSVGAKTGEKLNRAGIRTVRDIRERPEEVMRLLGRQGQWIARLAYGEDDRPVMPYRPEDAKSISREMTFQQDVADTAFLRDVLLLLSLSVSARATRVGLYGEGVTLKLTFSDMRSITRSKLVPTTRSPMDIWQEAVRLLDQVRPGPVRLIGTGLYHMIGEKGRQLRMEELLEETSREKDMALQAALSQMGRKYGLDFAGNLDKLFQGETLYKTAEYMRRHAGA